MVTAALGDHCQILHRPSLERERVDHDDSSVAKGRDTRTDNPDAE
jgi:hypothetical protein